MLFKEKFLRGIRDGSVTVAFRRWCRPSVRSGGRLRTGIGELEIRSVTAIRLDHISAADARNAGYESRDALMTELAVRPEGTLYRIDLGALRPDPRISLRETPADSAAEYNRLVDKLKRLDSRAPEGPWTRRVLELVRAHPGVRAGDLCGMMGQEKEPFKINVRKLKDLGLTESLEVGYRLSPRGEALLNSVRSGS